MSDDSASDDEQQQLALQAQVQSYRDALVAASMTGATCCRENCTERLLEHWETVTEPIVRAARKQPKHQIRTGIKFMVPNLAAYPFKTRVHVDWRLPLPIGKVCAPELARFFGLTLNELRTTQAQATSELFSPYEHGLTKRETSNNAILPSTSKFVIDWALSKAEKAGILEPTRRERNTAARNGKQTIFLPTMYTQKRLYEECLFAFKNEAIEAWNAELARRRPRKVRNGSGDDAVDVTVPISFSTFVKLFTTHEDISHVCIRSMRTDVCDMCLVLRNQLSAASKRNDAETVRSVEVRNLCDSIMKEWDDHISWADAARAKYSGEVYRSQDTMPIESDGTPIDGRTWEDWEMHLTFGFSQQLELPHLTDQPGKFNFASLIAVNIFGVCNDGLNLQTNFMFMEGDGAKGSSAVVTMLDLYLAHMCKKYGQENVKKIKVLRLHADNCGGQNKNNTILQYLMWLTSSLGRAGYGFETIELKFMPKGHTKSSADRNFGVGSNAFKKHDVFTIEQAASVYGATASNDVVVLKDGDMLDFGSKLSMFFGGLPGVLSYSEFFFSSTTPGIVKARALPDDPLESFDLWAPKERGHAPALRRRLDSNGKPIMVADLTTAERLAYGLDENGCEPGCSYANKFVNERYEKEVLVPVADSSLTLSSVLSPGEERSSSIGTWRRSYNELRNNLEKQMGKGIPDLKRYDLYTKIRPFVPPEFQDQLCPRPDNFDELQRAEIAEQHKVDQLRANKANKVKSKGTDMSGKGKGKGKGRGKGKGKGKGKKRSRDDDTGASGKGKARATRDMGQTAASVMVVDAGEQETDIGASS